MKYLGQQWPLFIFYDGGKYDLETQVRSLLTVGENGHVQLSDTLGHSSPIRESLDEDSVHTNLLELLGPRHRLFPAVDKGIGPREHEYIKALIAGVACGLDAGKCLAA